jgi:hypothetical protein
VGAVCILIYGVEESKVLTDDLKVIFVRMIYKMDQDPRASRIMKKIQEYVSSDFH